MAPQSTILASSEDEVVDVAVQQLEGIDNQGARLEDAAIFDERGAGVTDEPRLQWREPMHKFYDNAVRYGLCIARPPTCVIVFRSLSRDWQ